MSVQAASALPAADMAKAFHQELRRKVIDSGYTLSDIAERIGVEPSSLTHRLQYETPWRLTDIYCICDMLDIPYYDISIYFPPQTRTLRRDLTNEANPKYEFSHIAQVLVGSLEKMLLQEIDEQ